MYTPKILEQRKDHMLCIQDKTHTERMKKPYELQLFLEVKLQP